MTNDEYLPFEAAFRLAATPRLEILREHLAQAFGKTMGPIEIVDHDVSRGLGFQALDDGECFVELMLEDGAEHGFEGVGLNMTCSTLDSGVVWCPGIYTENVGITDPAEIERIFLDAFNARGISSAIATQWSRVMFLQRPASSGPERSQS